MSLFAFPALTAGPPSRRNWYQELLDHPDCHGPQQVFEAYSSHRDAYLSKSLATFTSPHNPVSPDQALLSHLQRLSNTQHPSESSTSDLANFEVNCLGFSARPSPAVISTIHTIQSHITALVGQDFYPMPAEHLHIAILELAHRHTLSYLYTISASVGPARLQKMLDLINTCPSKPRLVSPRLSLDVMGVALTFLPSTKQEYTYHHLRAEMHAIALESGEKFDMCYTAPSAHVTVGRFVGNGFCEEGEKRRVFIELVEEINEELGRDGGKEDGWVLCEEGGMELQAGYLKYGVDREKADMLGREV
ncbi:hypothetical protein EK21DRAFT_80848 [Setomelanomma holmii]|uniref:RNA ligase/cyclic nucleotide phosphodiesterase n=1 Tax=Setomelanomma holmii TaxID=210430 RepID=A0A9P4LGE4_9PLEO|nr:hypothetical protein EK21DRAFT_80848 [Setomelanomma holmii]